MIRSKAVEAVVAAATLVGMVATSGCYRWYTGIYYAEGSSGNVSVTLDDLSHQIEEAVTPFGLRRDYLRPEIDFVGFSRDERAKIAPEFSHLKGAATTQLSVAAGARPFRITVRDLSSDHETEFVRALKRRIEEQLKIQFGLEHLEFRRQWDLFP